MQAFLFTSVLIFSLTSFGSVQDSQFRTNTSKAHVGCGKPSEVWAGTYKAKQTSHPNDTFCVLGFDYLGSNAHYDTLRVYFNSMDKSFNSLKSQAEKDAKSYNAASDSKKTKIIQAMMKKYKKKNSPTLSYDYYKYAIEKTTPVVARMIEYKNKEVDCNYNKKTFNAFGNVFCGKIKDDFGIDIIVKNEAQGQKLHALNFPSRPSTARMKK